MRSTWRFGAALTCGIVALPAGVAWAASTPSWEAVPSMITPRAEHSATVLQDGRVLVVGGFTEVDDGSPDAARTAVGLAAVEIYDPATRTWSPAAPLYQGRHGHAAVLLPDGQVLVAGGRIRREQSGTELSSAELYDPTNDTWTKVGYLAKPHPAPSMVLVDGRPVLVGMAWSNSLFIDELNAAVYDPTSRSWTPTALCRESTINPVSATLLHDGRVMSVGSSCSIYDLETRLWTNERRPVLSTSRYRYPDAMTLASGGVLVTGGTLSGPDPAVHAFSQVYFPQEDRWAATSGSYAPASSCGTAPSSSSIRGTRTSLLPSGKVLLTGGLETCGTYTFYGTKALFDEATLAWSSLDLESPATLARAFHSSTRLEDGSVLLAGGYVGATTPTASAVLFHERSPLGAGCATDSDCGSGSCADSVCCDARCDGPCDACAAASGASQDGACTPVTGAACDDADACIAGGVCEAGACVGGAAAPDGTPCSDGDVCSTASACVAGACEGSSLAVCLPADECHEAPACDPAAGCAAPGPALPDGTPCAFPGAEDRWQETARIDASILPGLQTTVLLDETVLVIGGAPVPGRNQTRRVWTRYDPSTGAWAPTATIDGLRSAQTPTLLPDGTVLVIGDSPFVSTDFGPAPTRRFDPATGVWTPAASTVAPRFFHTATLLQDGRVLVAGGDKPGGAGGVLVEVYDPVVDTWTARAPMNVARQNHSATLLQDGRVLVAGGADGYPPESPDHHLTSAETYDPATDTWTPVASMRWARMRHTATLLPDGRVLVAGSWGTESGKTVEIYDPSSDTWTSAAEMTTARRSPGAALFADGRVMMAGNSHDESDGALAAELYDPASDTWALGPALDVMVNDHATALLNDGRVLIAGGNAGSVVAPYQKIDHAWLYVPAQPASRGACQAGACVPGGDGTGGDGAGGGTGGDGGAGGTGTSGDGGGISAGVGGDPTGGGGANSGNGGDPTSGGGGANSGNGGDPTSGGGGANSGGGGANGGNGGDPTSGGGGANGGNGGDPTSGGGGSATGSASANATSGAGGDATSGVGTGAAAGGGGEGGAATGGDGGGASSEVGATSTTTAAGGDDASSAGTGATGAQSSGGGDLPSAGGGGGCHMTPGSQGAPAWLLALGALATARLRRRLARSSRT
ncbi:Kelch repeat-containing protein [Sorangium atrum]|uniref:Kelch repeat-containing protein n=1 Tax=Sorangium atrum TaxID=2995308 RepID=A0ABT5BW58_9BACT|nr:kelch repeat-containing protein [Sorangium aterium]MDC0678373.1 kelch repeat-containing protein [Sorangium aterium]